MKIKVILVCFVWLVILAIGAMTLRWVIRPAREAAQEKAVEEKKQQVLTQTGASSRYDFKVRYALDSFSGYAVLRSQQFSDELAKKRGAAELVDDGADYPARFQGLKTGDIQMASFTVDSLVTTCAAVGDLPATIVAIIDETRGADAMVAFKTAFPNLDALDDPETRFVLTPKSPSEMLARVVMARFNLKRLASNPFIEVKDAEEVYKRYRAAKPTDKLVFVLWEPFVSKILENPNTQILIDSSRFRGYIVDVVVANRNFLYQNRDAVSAVVEAYFRANYTHRDKYVDLVLQDAQKQGTPLSQAQAENLVKGIWWKNCQENYAHFGLHDSNKLQHIEDIIGNITKVLRTTKGIESDPTNGKPNLFYYTGILEDLKKRGFHPGIEVEQVRNDTVVLPTLTEAQWASLQPVGTLEVPPLVFARGTAMLTEASQSVLDELLTSLNTFPQYYVTIKGNASKEGDLEANKELAQRRAKAAEQYLIQRGISDRRVKAVAVEPSGETRVDFVLGQTPY